MARPGKIDVLLALLGTTPSAPVTGDQVLSRLEVAGKRTSASGVLALLLDMETSGHVAIERHDGYRFALTSEGQRAAYAAGPGEAVDATVIMVDLVGFTAFTERSGDAAARDMSQLVTRLTDEELRRSGGRVVKSLGDGVLAMAPPDLDAVSTVVALRQRLGDAEAGEWTLRAAAHVGCPIEHKGDIFGSDVNLVARLCELAEPDQLVLSTPSVTEGTETVTVRGFTRPVGLRRVDLAAVGS